MIGREQASAPCRGKGRKLRSLTVVCLVVAALCALAVAAQTADAEFGIAGFDGQVTAGPEPVPSPNPGDPTDPANFAPPFTQAGGHPYDASTTIDFNTASDVNGNTIADGDAKDLEVELPQGFVGNPTAVTQCEESGLANAGGAGANCPASAQVGVAVVRTPFYPAGLGVQTLPIYNLQPADGVAAAFGFNIGGAGIVHLIARVRTSGDYGLTIVVPDISQALSVLSTRVTFWGTPAASVHTPERGRQCADFFGLGTDCSSFPGGQEAEIKPLPFLTNPVDCSAGPLTTVLNARSWADWDRWTRRTFTSHLAPALPSSPEVWGAPQGVTGCDRVPFDPKIAVTPTTMTPDSPTGLGVELTFPSDGIEAVNGIATAYLKRARVVLPDGMTVNPSAAAGLGACTDAELGFGSDTPVRCPNASKIGTVEATTPVLEEHLTGGIYIRPQASDIPESGDMFRIAIVLESAARGVRVKLAGRIRASEVDGRLETTFDDNPQLPVSSIRLDFKSGPRAPLATPQTCGEKTTTAELTSWAGHVVTRTSSYAIPCPADLGFAPSFAAGTLNPVGGTFSALALRIDRPDGQQFLSGLKLELPRGVSAALKGVPVCGEAQANAGSCPPDTRIGTATVGSGAGIAPFFLTGGLYLTGPYQGAPIGLAVSVRALAGPFDLGTVVVRQAVGVDPSDAHVTVRSDPVPVVVRGVPIRLRSLNVDVDRPGFMVNPTTCREQRVIGNLSSSTGAAFNASSRFQVGDCSSLAFRPRMTLRVGAKGRTKRGITTPLTVALTMPPGHANNRSVQVTLPRTLNSRLEVVNRRRACSIEQFRADRCPFSVGSGEAVTPLLRDPLAGPAYLVYNPARRLPDLVVRLRGQVNVDLVGKVSITRDLRLRTTFDTVPDVAVTRFTLRLVAGRRGPIGIVRDLCVAANRARSIADLDLIAQNGKQLVQHRAVGVAGCARAKKQQRSEGRATRR